MCPLILLTHCEYSLHARMVAVVLCRDVVSKKCYEETI